MTVTLTSGASAWDITGLLTSWTWSGDKNAVSRQLTGSIACIEDSGLPVPALGDRVELLEGGKRLFMGVVLLRSMGSEDTRMSFTAYDMGYYLQRNDGTYKFTGATPEAMTRLVCSERGIPVAGLPVSGVQLWRKFSGVKLSQIVITTWTLAAEKNGKAYALRYTPEGLLVTERQDRGGHLILQGGSNLMDAATKEDASQMVNSVAVYDAQGNFLRRMGDAQAQTLYGVMEQHHTQTEGKAADADAIGKRILEDGKLRRTVTVNTLGDLSLVTGETVTVREPRTGLTGVFWIDADVHTWKNNNYYTRLTLNCRNVMTRAEAGSDLS